MTSEEIKIECLRLAIDSNEGKPNYDLTQNRNYSFSHLSENKFSDKVIEDAIKYYNFIRNIIPE